MNRKDAAKVKAAMASNVYVKMAIDDLRAELRISKIYLKAIADEVRKSSPNITNIQGWTACAMRK